MQGRAHVLVQVSAKARQAGWQAKVQTANEESGECAD